MIAHAKKIQNNVKDARLKRKSRTAATTSKATSKTERPAGRRRYEFNCNVKGWRSEDRRYKFNGKVNCFVSLQQFVGVCI